MREIKGYLRQVSATGSTVLITGETGTGKELATEIIHCNSSRCTRPLVFIDCAALPENLVESELFGYERGGIHRRCNLKTRQIPAGQWRDHLSG